MARMTWEELRHLPSAVDLETAGRALGIGRSKIYEMARTGELQQTIRVLKLGHAYRVATADLYRVLGVTVGNEPATSGESAGPRATTHPAALPDPLAAAGTSGAGSPPEETPGRAAATRRSTRDTAVQRVNPDVSAPHAARPAH